MTKADLETRKAQLDEQIEIEEATTGEVTLATALAWWDVATTLRDMREQVFHPGYPRQH